MEPTPNPPQPAGLVPDGHSPALAGAAEVVALVRRLSDAQGRDDLAAQLDRIRADLAIRPVRVAVVGSGQQGKSTLVNALVGAPVCPVGGGASTAVPVELHFARSYDAQLVSDLGPDGRHGAGPTRTAVPFAEAHALATTAVNGANTWRLRAIELGVPSAALERGLCIVDTPPLAELWQPDDLRIVQSLGSAAAVVLVTSASAELTSTEIDLLRVAHGLCQHIIVAVNGIHSYPQWASVVDRNQLLLDRNGISATVFAVDAAPYWSDDGGLPPGPDPGMRSLLAHLEEAVLLEEEQHRISTALTEAFWAADRLRMRLLTERSLIGDDRALDAAIARLRGAAADAQELCGADAPWATSFVALMRRLRLDIERDLTAQLDQLRTEAARQAAVPGLDPRQFRAWLHDRMSHATVRFQRVRKLSLRAFCDRVAQEFRHDWGVIVAGLAISPEAHALLYPRLDRPSLLFDDDLARIALPPASLGEAPAALDRLAEQWLRQAEAFLRADTDAVLARVEHGVDQRCRARAGELHRSLVEVLTALTILRGVAPAVVEQRQETLSTDIERLTALDWRMPIHLPHEIGAAGPLDLREPSH